MSSNFDDVGEFHQKFGLDNVSYSEPGPRELPDDAVEFRLKFMQEELDEFAAGAAAGDHAQMADALVDLVYVAMGTAHLSGYPWQELWNEVQRANLTKVRASSAADARSKRGHELDVVKPEGWQPPDVEEVLRRHGWSVDAKPRENPPVCPRCKHELNSARSVTTHHARLSGNDDNDTTFWVCVVCQARLPVEVVKALNEVLSDS